MRVSVSGKQFVFPRSCACCGAFATTTLAVMGTERNKRARTKGWTWDIPYCRACKRHIRLFDYLLIASLSLLALASVLGAVIATIYGSWQLGIAVCTLLIAGIGSVDWLMIRLIRRASPRNCYMIARAVDYLGSDGSCHTFDLKSRFYAVEFVLANHHKVVNASVQVASILKGTKFGDYQVPRRIFKRS